MTTYQRPVEAKILVHLDNGEAFEATPGDLEKFGLVNARDAYMIFNDELCRLLTDAGLIDGDLTDAKLNALRYLVETAIVNPDLIGHSDHNDWDEVVDTERTLQRRDNVPDRSRLFNAIYEVLADLPDPKIRTDKILREIDALTRDET